MLYLVSHLYLSLHNVHHHPRCICLLLMFPVIPNKSGSSMRADTPADIVAGAKDSIWHLEAAQKTLNEWMPMKM